MTSYDRQRHLFFFSRVMEEFPDSGPNRCYILLCPDPRAAIHVDYDGSSGCHFYLIENSRHQWTNHPGLQAASLNKRLAAWRELFARDAARLPVDFRLRTKLTAILSQPP